LGPEIAMVGHILNEIIQFPDRTIGPVLGSPAAYSSVVAARLGARVGVVTRIGTDMPQELLKPFYDAKVDTRGIKIEGEDSTTNLLVYFPSGDKEIRYLKKAPPIVFEDIPKDYLDSDIMYICTMDYDVPLETIKKLSTLGSILAIDLGGYGGAHASSHPSEEEKKSPRALKELVKHFQVVRASVEDCRHLFGNVEGREEEIVSLFINWGADVGLMTLGERGSVAATKDGVIRIPAVSGNVIDQTGAGDVFSSGFLVEYLRTRDVKRSGIFASVVALHVIEGTGGVLASRMPTREQVERRLRDLEGGF
jgi:sugar/nucleoside kinase (ribokinase family)